MLLFASISCILFFVGSPFPLISSRQSTVKGNDTHLDHIHRISTVELSSVEIGKWLHYYQVFEPLITILYANITTDCKPKPHVSFSVAVINCMWHTYFKKWENGKSQAEKKNRWEFEMFVALAQSVEPKRQRKWTFRWKMPKNLFHRFFAKRREKRPKRRQMIYYNRH